MVPHPVQPLERGDGIRERRILDTPRQAWARAEPPTAGRIRQPHPRSVQGIDESSTT